MSKAQKGDRTERELVNGLHDEGFSVMRAPSSGSATDRNMPDVDAKNGAAGYAIEGKSSGDETIYINGEEIEGLMEYASRSGMRVRIGVRFDREPWLFLHPAELDFTRGGNYKATLEMAKENGQTIEDLKKGEPCKPRNTKNE